ncbi:hypothetical protein CBL_08457 [Carabus blaptoides fortunei]
MSSSSSSDEEIIILAASVVAELQKKNVKGRYGELRGRKIGFKEEMKKSGRGGLALIHNELRVEDKTAYKNYLRMDEKCFLLLLQKIEHDITYKNTRLRQCISARDSSELEELQLERSFLKF